MSDEMIEVEREYLVAIYELAMIGDAILHWLSVTALFGHASPGSSLDYIHPTNVGTSELVRDFVAWTSGRKKYAPGCDERLREFGMEQTRSRMESASKRLLSDLKPTPTP